MAIGEGDSTARLNITHHIFTEGFSWNVSNIWPPFYFAFYTLPLYLYKSWKSILIFQIILSLVSLALYYLVVNKIFNKKIALLSSITLLCLPTAPKLYFSALSETPFFFFFILGVITQLYSKKFSALKYIVPIWFLCAAMIRLEGWVVLPLFYLILIYKKEYRVVALSFPLCFYCFYMAELGFYQSNGASLSAFTNIIKTTALEAKIASLNYLDSTKNFFKALFFETGIIVLIFFGSLIHVKKHKMTALFLASCGASIWLMYMTGMSLQKLTILNRYFFFPTACALPFVYFSIDRIKKEFVVVFLLLHLVLFNPLEPNVKIVKPFKNNTDEKIFRDLRKREFKSIFIGDWQDLYLHTVFETFNLYSGGTLDVHVNRGEIYRSTNRIELTKSLLDNVINSGVRHFLLAKDWITYQKVFIPFYINNSSYEVKELTDYGYYSLYELKKIQKN